MTGFTPKRFDVAGAHPDEAWRAVDNAADVVKEMQAQAAVDGVKVEAWLASKPLRFGNAPDADVQRFLARGVQLMDGLKDKLALGMSARQGQVRNRCNELSKSMEKVLAQRADEPQPFDPWRPVKVRVAPGAMKDGRALSASETRDRYVLALKGCFPRGPAQADRARTQYRVWEQNAERFHRDGPMNEAAQSWKRFMGVIDNMRSRAEAKGIVWGRVDDVTGIDFKPALQMQVAFRNKPKMRM